MTGLECRGSVETIVNNWCDGALLHSSLVLPARGWSHPGGREGGEAVSVAGLYYGPILQSDIITPTSLSVLGELLISTDKTK